MLDIVRHDVDIEEAIEIIAKYDLLSIPVRDEVFLPHFFLPCWI